MSLYVLAAWHGISLVVDKVTHIYAFFDVEERSRHVLQLLMCLSNYQTVNRRLVTMCYWVSQPISMSGFWLALVTISTR